MKKVLRKRTLQVATVQLEVNAGGRLVCASRVRRPCEADLTITHERQTPRQIKAKSTRRPISPHRLHRPLCVCARASAAQRWKHLLGCINAQAHSH